MADHDRRNCGSDRSRSDEVTQEEPSVERRKKRESERPAKGKFDRVDEAGRESFPASDPPSFTPEKST